MDDRTAREQSMASFCISSFMSALFRITFLLPAAPAEAAFRSSAEALNLKYAAAAAVAAAPPPLFLSSAIFFFYFVGRESEERPDSVGGLFENMLLLSNFRI